MIKILFFIFLTIFFIKQKKVFGGGGNKKNKNLLKNYNNLISLYRNRNNGPPFWVKNYILHDEGKTFIEDCKKSTVYAVNLDLDKVKKLTTQRDIVNIAMKRPFDKKKLLNLFKYKNGIYGTEGYQNLNISIYCHTPFIQKKNYKKEQFNLNNKIHIISVYGLALDSKKQPDYIYLNKMKKIEERKKYVYNIYKTIFIQVLQCAVDKNLNEIIFTGVGLGFFNQLSKKLKIETKQIFIEILSDYIKIFKEKNKKLMFGYYTKKLKTISNKNQLKFDILDYPFENMIEKQNTLYVNAWDPFSLVGNGHFNDNSLDGNVGAQSAASILCWPITNKYINYKIIRYNLEENNTLVNDVIDLTLESDEDEDIKAPNVIDLTLESDEDEDIY